MNSYRDNSLLPFKEEVEQLRKEYLANQEVEFQKELEQLKDEIKATVAKGNSQFGYRVDQNEIRFWPFFRPKMKPGTKSKRVFDKLIELGFTPEIKTWGELRIYF